MNEVDEYIIRFPLDIQEKLTILRETVKRLIPDCEETIKYGIPTFTLKNKNIIHFAGYNKHIGLYPTPTLIELFEDDLKGYKVSKGTIQFSLEKELPIDLIEKIIKSRVLDIK